MHPHAANPAAQPDLSLSIFGVPTANCEERNGGGANPSYSGAVASTRGQRFGRTSAAEKQWDDKVQWESSASYPVLCSGHASGLAPRVRRSLAMLGVFLNVDDLFNDDHFGGTAAFDQGRFHDIELFNDVPLFRLAHELLLGRNSRTQEE